MHLTLHVSITPAGSKYASDLPVNALKIVAENRAEFLDPVYWRPSLHRYAAATHIAVQLFDIYGKPITECLNPQPLWKALREKSGRSPGCGFSIAGTDCQCSRDAFQQRTAVFVREVSGIVHFAVPLFLENNAIGVLLAGQVFDRYPEMLSLERAAGKVASIRQIWDLARRALPLGMPTLRVYSDLLITLADAVLQARYQSVLEAERLEQLHTAVQKTNASLAEKEALLKEVHHRVKNNLQVICSLLSLQSNHLRDEGAITMFDEMRERIQSIAAIHESLYRSNTFTAIDVVAKARYLAEALVRFYGAQERVNIEFVEHENVAVLLPIETAVPCGLIMHELLSNALKHAFPLRKSGRIRVTIGEHEGHCSIELSDDGVGMPRDFAVGKAQSFGLALVDLLVSQLDGTLDIESHDSRGTTVHMRFPRPSRCS